MKIRILSAFTIIILILPIISGGSNNPELDYLRLKAAGRYIEALTPLTELILRSNDPAEIETGIFRINELIVYPEVNEPAEKALGRIASLPAVKNNPNLNARVKLAKNRICLAGARISESKSIINELGYLNFQITGPFSAVTVDDFEAQNPAEEGSDPGASYEGKSYRTGWYDAISDLEGTVNAANFMPDLNDALCILYTEIYAASAGDYTLAIGKTGYTKIKIEGITVFDEKSRHGFHHDQYLVTVRLSEGRHRVMVKTAGSEAGIRFSMRISDSRGKNLSPASESARPPAAMPQLKKTEYFTALQSALAGSADSQKNPFRAGYLLIESGLALENNSLALEHLSSIKKDDPFFPYAAYQTARSERAPEDSERYLKISFEADNRSIETLAAMAIIKLKAGFLHEAYPLIKKIKEIDPGSHYNNLMLTRFYYQRGWYLEAVKQLELIETSGYPSSGLLYSAAFHYQGSRYPEAAVPLRRLHSADRYSISVLNDLATCLRRSGHDREAMGLLWQAAALHPDMVSIRLLMADIAAEDEGPASSLRHIASAQRISPYNKDVFLTLGLTYDRMNRVDTAREFIKLASLYDPDNFEIRRYLSLHDQAGSPVDSFAHPADITGLINEADKYKDEPAMVLLQETIINVNADGSFEKNVRNVYQINDKEHASSFQYQYIVFDPHIEYPENIRCVKIRNGEHTEVTGRFRRSLSDPDSRLYYNLESIVIPVDIESNTVIDFSYTVKNSGGAAYKQYFGEKIIKGSKYRTIRSNTALIHPEKRNIYHHTREIKSSDIITTRSSKGRSVSIQLKNIPPYKEEAAMPHSATVLPSVYFSSFKTWENLTSYYRNLMHNRVRLTPSMKNDISSLISENDDDEAKIRKIFNHVTSKIRYVGFEFTLGGIQPRPTDETYRSGMGDCKDVSLLLAAMLREAGIDAAIALVRTRDKGDADLTLPFLGEFNHAICYVKTSSGKEIFLDATSRNSSYRELPGDDRNIKALVIDDRTGRWFVRNTDTGIYENNYELINTAVTIRKDGSAYLTRKLTKHGTLAASTRDSLADNTKKVRSLSDYWGRLFPGSAVRELNIISREKDNPAAYSYSVTVPSFSSASEEIIYFNAFINRSDIYSNFAVPTARVFPLVLGGKTATEIQKEYIIPEGYKAVLPRSDSKQISGIKSEFSYSISDNKIKVRSYYEYTAYSISVEDYDDFRKMAEFIQTHEAGRIVLIKKK